jgi:urease alpha subunit
MAAAYGLGVEGALATITRDAAAILGISHRVGTLETGKDGDVVLFDGDPFEYTSHVCAVIIEGRVVEEACRAGRSAAALPLAAPRQPPRPKKHEHRMEKQVPPRPFVPPCPANRVHPSSPSPARRDH